MKENRDSFVRRIRRLFAPSEVNRLLFAYNTAKAYHRNQWRDELDEHGQPMRYFEHARRVMLFLLDVLGIRDVDVICAGGLHDTDEDCEIDLNYIEQFLGTRPVRFITVVTHEEDETDAIYARRLFRYGKIEEILIKFADRYDNLRSLGVRPPAKRRKKALETRKLYLPGFREAAELIEDPRVKARYLRKLAEMESMVEEHLKA